MQAGVDAIIYVGPVDYWTKNNRFFFKKTNIFSKV